MSQRTRLGTLAVLALLLCPSLAFLSTPAASAGESLPTDREQRQTMEAAGFPDASDLGAGWSQGYAYSFPGGRDFPFDGHVVTYTDRYGNRIGLWAVMFDRGDGPEAYDAVANRVADNAAALYAGSETPTASDLRRLDDPRGCDQVDRAVGEDPIMYFYVGTLSCLDTDNGRALWVGVSGLYEGDNYQEAAEAVLEIVLDTEPGD